MEHDQLYKQRHTLAHVMAAVLREHDPAVKMAIGPVIDTGFYYDFEFSEGKAPNEQDFPKLEKKMRGFLQKGFEVTQWDESKAEALERFKEQPYKVELINELEGDTVSIYQVGDFIDLCKGPHVESSKEIPQDAFKIMSVAGAYWRGDENNKMLTRVYAASFESKEALDAHLKMLEESAARDHRKLGKELDLFAFSPLIGPGLPLYTPRGQAMIETITDFLWEVSKKYGYHKVSIPHITKLDLYETSGHAAKFKDEFFYVHGAQSNDDFVLKPMNCPHHTQIYASKPRSYRDLPIRMAEITRMYRDEKPGELVGLGRTRAISVDDGHIFCTPDQIKQEAINITKIIEEFYQGFNLWKKGETFWVSLSVRDPENLEKYLGTDENWDKAEKYLQEVSDELGLDAKRMEGEAAFYGPKLDFMFKDALGRERQLGTVQIDFVMPERFGLEYTDADGTKKQAVMVHRAIAGSMERFLAIMIEHYAGAFPMWLAPTQVSILPISDAHKAYADEVYAALKDAEIRVELDDSSETLGKKIRNAKLQKVPYFLVIGDQEVESKQVKIEGRDGEGVLLSIEEMVKKFEDEIEQKK